jgi:hypothetical protein
MIKRILLAVLLLYTVSQIKAQCVPDPTITVPGVYPDSATGLATGMVGVPYNQVIQVRTFLDSLASITIGAQTVTTNFRLDSITITGVSGLPAGLTYACNPGTCKFLPNSNGCLLISGTPITAGIYPITVSVMAKGKLTQLGNIPYSQPFTVTYYTITIDTNSGVMELLPKDKLSLSQNLPNPFSSKSTVYYNSPANTKIEFKIYNILGKTIYSEILTAKKGINTYVINAENMNSGIYMYAITTGSTTVTRRMVVSK